MSWRERNVPIVAVATASGRGAVGIVRVSGKGLQPLIQALCGRELQPRVATYGPFKDARGEALDQGLAIFFPGPHSYTGEDVLELQGHGGPVVMQLLLARCLEAAAEPDPATERARLPGLRLAEPGEFTQRAFLNDKIDLAQAEAIADLIDASTEAAARSATRSLGGAFSREIEALRDQLINLRMLVEATLDFPEEEIDFLEKADARGRLNRVAATLDGVLGQARQGALLREGLQVVLAGQPNAGKSSLLNALAGAELAIVTPIAGTTRDKVSETIQIEGVPLHVIDTAGLRADHEASDEVERIGMARSWEAIGQADAVLFLHDLTRMAEPAYAQADADIARRLPEGVPVVHVFNKADAVAVDQASLQTQARPEGPLLALSARTGEGLQALRQTLLQIAGWQAAQEGVFIARQRHVQALRLAREHLEMAQAHAALSDGALDLLAEELRLAHNALGTITGAFSADDLLGEIFTRFCIGK
ncbi:MAG TPA: tRNA uridine-5-carboxymethylaminomethyl(34) synthesis GTPase MnmE [Aquabacterium sp.]|uniref:tRNA uridine-5-carboxymethylaminomethyl(34) synthesis GTPase MnmE n=1 Tax=Aquabacterium sp. TaxID=1872578 RepID=UPI002E30363C|nr:tRNA uridine-5-carboxymethylaminomethyl(34) synthesis GTPase MnmE [Aquabacterium sp.]HEX5354638.1 tRNA uridine-5-carboxymethylaminomethyl(34) synthesis GTPase MnmE [Aquabacterium sp.]